jgi:hypothetical protein
MCSPFDSNLFIVTAQANHLIRAWLAQKKAEGGFIGDTVETLTWKIYMILEGLKLVCLLFSLSHYRANLIRFFDSQNPKKLIPSLDDPKEPDVKRPSPDPIDEFLKKNVELKEATAKL